MLLKDKIAVVTGIGTGMGKANRAALRQGGRPRGRGRD